MDSPCIKQTVCKVLNILLHRKHLVAYVLNESKYFIISCVACYLYMYKHSSFSFIALLFMPNSLSEHEQSGAIRMLKLWCVFLTPPVIKIVICRLYSASEIVNMLLVQLQIDAGLVNQQ